MRCFGAVESFALIVPYTPTHTRTHARTHTHTHTHAHTHAHTRAHTHTHMYQVGNNLYRASILLFKGAYKKKKKKKLEN